LKPQNTPKPTSSAALPRTPLEDYSGLPDSLVGEDGDSLPTLQQPHFPLSDLLSWALGFGPCMREESPPPLMHTTLTTSWIEKTSLLCMIIITTAPFSSCLTGFFLELLLECIHEKRTFKHS